VCNHHRVRQRRRQRPDCSTGIAHEQIGLMHRQHAIDAMHDIILGIRHLLPLHTQLLQGHEHHQRVIGSQQILDLG